MPNRFPNALPMTEKEKIVEYLFGVYRIYTSLYYLSPINLQYLQDDNTIDDYRTEKDVRLILALTLALTLPFSLSYQLVSQKNQYSPSNIDKDFHSASNLSICGFTSLVILTANYFSESPYYPKHNATLLVFATLAFIKSAYEYNDRKKSFVALTEAIKNNNATIPLDWINSRVLTTQETAYRSQEQYYNSKTLLTILQAVAAYTLYMYVNIGNDPNCEKQMNLNSAAPAILLFAHLFEKLWEIGVLGRIQEYCGLRSADAQQSLLNSDELPFSIVTPFAIAIPCQQIEKGVANAGLMVMINQRTRDGLHAAIPEISSNVDAPTPSENNFSLV